MIKQLSVFIENRTGRLEQVTEKLSNNNIDITALSLADTSEYGILRMIVSNPYKGKEVLRSAGFSAMLTDVIAVRLSNEPGTLNKLLIALDGVNIEYMYAVYAKMQAAMILKFTDMEKAKDMLIQKGFEILKENDVYHLTDNKN